MLYEIVVQVRCGDLSVKDAQDIIDDILSLSHVERTVMDMSKEELENSPKPSKRIDTGFGIIELHESPKFESDTYTWDLFNDIKIPLHKEKDMINEIIIQKHQYYKSTGEEANAVLLPLSYKENLQKRCLNDFLSLRANMNNIKSVDVKEIAGLRIIWSNDIRIDQISCLKIIDTSPKEKPFRSDLDEFLKKEKPPSHNIKDYWFPPTTHIDVRPTKLRYKIPMQQKVVDNNNNLYSYKFIGKRIIWMYECAINHFDNTGIKAKVTSPFINIITN